MLSSQPLTLFDNTFRDQDGRLELWAEKDLSAISARLEVLLHISCTGKRSRFQTDDHQISLLHIEECSG